jgi:hypothetical protein
MTETKKEMEGKEVGNSPDFLPAYFLLPTSYFLETTP